MFSVPAGQPRKVMDQITIFIIESGIGNNKINSTPDIGVSCEQGAAAATVAAEHDKLTQLKEMGETNDEAAENRRIRYQNLYFEYFNGEAHEMIPAR